MSSRPWLRQLFGFHSQRQTTFRNPRRSRPQVEVLEDRLVPADFRVTAQLQVLPTDGGNGAPGRQVVFFESGVADYRVLQKGLAAGADAVVLDGGGDGLAEMAAFLKGRHDLTAIHIVSHGAPGALELGTATLDEQALKTDAAAVTALGAALAPHGDLLLWGCNVADGSAGQTFVRDLAGRSGANVAASARPVGAADLGGSWELQARVGNVQSATPFSASARGAFHTLLPWLTSSTLSTARSEQTATLLANGKVLVTGGSNGIVSLSSAQLYDPDSNTWSVAAAMSTVRSGHTATLLANGKVLVTGGYNDSISLSSAQLYDPGSNTWSAAAAMSTPRFGHTATLLADGKVLVAGGFNLIGGYLASSELYDPGSNTWSTARAMSTARLDQTATLLANGKVLVAGGLNGSYISSAELYDPGSNTWSAAAAMSMAREYHTATLLANGKVLVAGGSNGSTSLSSAQLYDPASNTWSAAATLSTARSSHTATVLANGKVLVAGGFNGSGTLSSAQLYDPGSNTWSAAGAMSTARDRQTATLLTNGKVLVAGGEGASAGSSAEQYDSGSNTWSPGALSTARAHHTATLLANGKVLVAGGSNGSTSLSSAQLYDPGSNTWSTAAAMSTPRFGHTATLLANGKVLVTGGSNGIVSLSSAQLYDPDSNTWSVAASMGTARYGHTATLLANGKVLVAMGFNSSDLLSSAELYNPSTNSWSAAGNLSTARVYHTTTLLANGKVLVTGGDDSRYNILASAELYDPATNAWSAAAPLGTPRELHTATLLPNGKVLVAGGFSSGSLSSAVLYDPDSNTWSSAASMSSARDEPDAIPLADGKVLVVGGGNEHDPALSSAELYDPGSNTWAGAGALTTARFYHTTTLLANGRVLVAGGIEEHSSGILSSTELYIEDTVGSAVFVGQSVPGLMAEGQQYQVSVTMRNVGDTTWTPEQAYLLGSQNPQDNTTWGLNRVGLPGPVAPGQQVTFQFTATAPANPGTYDFAWRMVQEGVQWFGDFTPDVPVVVQVGPATHFAVSAPASTTAGSPSSVTVTALDASGHIATGYLGTVHFTSADPYGATLPADYTFTADDAGVHTFAGTTLYTAGSQTVTVSGTDLPAGAVSSWRGEGNALDSVGGNNGTLHGGVTFAPGEVGQAFDFNGNGQYVSVPYSSSLALNSYTVSAWINLATNPGGSNPYFGILGTRFGGEYTFDLKIEAGKVHGDIGDGSGWINTGVDYNATLTPGTWHLVTYAIDNTAKQFSLYLDGALQNTIPFSGTPHFMTPGETLEIGDSFAGAEYFNGLVDEVTVFNRPLAAAEVQGIYLNGSAGEFQTISGTASVNVVAAAAVGFQILAPAGATSGMAFDLTIIAVDLYGNTDTNYTGTVTFTTSDTDPAVVLPAYYSFTADDQGTYTFTGGFTLMTPGAWTITVADLANGLSQDVTLTVDP
jgi:N-acetylneuraminic acid mutarotase